MDVLVPGQRRELLDPGLHVVPGDPLAGGDGVEVDLVDDALVVLDDAVGHVHAEVALGLQDRDPQLPLEHDLVLGAPDGGEVGSRVAGGEDVGDGHGAIVPCRPGAAKVSGASHSAGGRQVSQPSSRGQARGATRSWRACSAASRTAAACGAEYGPPVTAASSSSASLSQSEPSASSHRSRVRSRVKMRGAAVGRPAVRELEVDVVALEGAVVGEEVPQGPRRAGGRDPEDPGPPPGRHRPGRSRRSTSSRARGRRGSGRAGRGPSRGRAVSRSDPRGSQPTSPRSSSRTTRSSAAK